MGNLKAQKRSIEVIVDQDPHLGYEINDLSKKAVNVFLIPVLNLIPASFQRLLKRTHKSAEWVIETATTHEAIEVLYNYGFRKYSRTLLHKFFHWVWFSTNNSKAIRNRLRLVKRELRSHIGRLCKVRNEVRLLSIAAGSARGVVELLNDFKDENVHWISTTFLDKSPEALRYSKEFAQEKGLVGLCKMDWVEKTVGTFFKEIRESAEANEKYDVVEMVGLMDYFKDEKAIEVFLNIHTHLSKEGVLITANISDNSERPFITNAVGWKMIYRDAEELVSLLEAGGFHKEKMKVFYEPLKIHCVVVAQK